METPFCEHCNTSRVRRPGRRFCSHRCHADAQILPRPPCERCGALVRNRKNRFCSARCNWQSMTMPRPPCERCAQPVADPQRRYCSRECASVVRRNPPRPLPSCEMCGKQTDRHDYRFCGRTCARLDRGRHIRSIIADHVSTHTPKLSSQLWRDVLDDYGTISHRNTIRHLSKMVALGELTRTGDGYLRVRKQTRRAA